jgi:hypothetical protein
MGLRASRRWDPVKKTPLHSPGSCISATKAEINIKSMRICSACSTDEMEPHIDHADGVVGAASISLSFWATDLRAQPARTVVVATTTRKECINRHEKHTGM